MEPLYLGLTIAGGAGLSGLAVWAAWRSTRVKADEPVDMERDDAKPLRSAHPAPIEARPVPTPTPVRAPVTTAPSRAPATPPPHSPRAHAERAPAMVLTAGVSMQDAEFSRYGRPNATTAPARAERPPMRMAPEPKSWAQQAMEDAKSAVPTEWARRQVGPVEPGRVAGACGGCGSRLSVTDTRPLRIACPVCGRTKLVA